MFKKTIKKIFPSAGEILDKFLINELNNCSSILDLGCGPSSPVSRIKKYINQDLYLVGVDDFDPYIKESQKKNIHSEYIKGNIFDINFPPDRKFDCALLLDVIEHFEKNRFLDFLPKLEKITKKIIIMTPNGFIEQEEYDGNHLQIHRSGWTVDDMESLGFKCFGLSGLKFLRKEKALVRIKPISLGNMISNISELFVYNNPELAFHLLCVKNNKEKK